MKEVVIAKKFSEVEAGQVFLYDRESVTPLGKVYKQSYVCTKLAQPAVNRDGKTFNAKYEVDLGSSHRTAYINVSDACVVGIPFAE